MNILISFVVNFAFEMHYEFNVFNIVEEMSNIIKLGGM